MHARNRIRLNLSVNKRMFFGQTLITFSYLFSLQRDNLNFVCRGETRETDSNYVDHYV